MLLRHVSRQFSRNKLNIPNKEMTRTAALLLPLLAMFQGIGAFAPFCGVRRFVSAPLRMSSVESGSQVFLGNLPFTLTEGDLQSLVGSKVQSFTSLKIAVDRNTGRSRGFAFVNFPDKAAAEAAAAALAGIQAEGRDIKVDVSEPRPRGDRPERTERPARTDRPERTERAPRPAPENSVFVGNLDYSVNEDVIKELFSEVLGADNVVKVRISTDRETGRPKGFAHVDFTSADVASQAVNEINGRELQGRRIKVDHAMRKEDLIARGPKPTRERTGTEFGEHSVYLGNLAWNVTPELVEDMVNDILGPGVFNQVRLSFDRETGRPRGFGHIDFKDAETAERAIRELNGLEVNGRQLRADYAQRGKKEEGGDRPPRKQRDDRFQGGAADGSFGAW